MKFEEYRVKILLCKSSDEVNGYLIESVLDDNVSINECKELTNVAKTVYPILGTDRETFKKAAVNLINKVSKNLSEE
jgi:hypothetical protein